MNKSQNNYKLNNLTKAFFEFDEHTDAYQGMLYFNIFNNFPLNYKIYYDNDKKLNYIKSSENFQTIQRNLSYKIDDRQLLNNFIKYKEKLDIEIIAYSKYEYFIIGGLNNDNNDFDFLLNLTMSDDTESISVYNNLYCKQENIENIFNKIKPLFGYSDKKEKIEFGIAAIDISGGIYTAWYQYSNQEIDIDKNYNDDFPYNKICSLIEGNDKPELLLFYGDAGTGKSSVIKHLISKYNEKEFVFIDGSILLNASQEKLMSYFLENQNTVFIFEDCEKILVNREHNYNPIMSTLLNITDGIIGDVLGIKIICTFNTSINNIDKALLRKGRLSLKYEFKKLNKEKVRKILNNNNINEDMTLADIYNYEAENDFSAKPSKKIGF